MHTLESSLIEKIIDTLHKFEKLHGRIPIIKHIYLDDHSYYTIKNSTYFTHNVYTNKEQIEFYGFAVFIVNCNKQHIIVHVE